MGKMNQTLTRALRKGLVLSVLAACEAFHFTKSGNLSGTENVLNDVHTGTCY